MRLALKMLIRWVAQLNQRLRTMEGELQVVIIRAAVELPAVQAAIGQGQLYGDRRSCRRRRTALRTMSLGHRTFGFGRARCTDLFATGGLARHAV